MQDPCAEAQPHADAATVLSQNNVYITTKNNIQAAAVDGNEHVVAFGKDANNNVTVSPINTGSSNSGSVPNWPNAFADLHNHLDDKPPSSGDLYGFIDRCSTNNFYETRYIVTANGTVYALVTTNLQAAINFNINYPRVSNPGYEPDFPDNLRDEFIEVRFNSGGSNEMAMAFILDKYNTGVALLKQDSNGNFKRLRTMENIANGITTYIANNCP